MALPRELKPSSGTEGFFQTPPKLENQLHEDRFLRRIFEFYIPKAEQPALYSTLAPFAASILTPEIFAYVSNAEAHPPTLATHTTFGAPTQTLRTPPGWQILQSLAQRSGLVAAPHLPFATYIARTSQFLANHLWAASCALTSCPLAMADGAAALLSCHLSDPTLPSLERAVFAHAFSRLTNLDPKVAWTSGQWMTERPGGSDVRNTETVARLAPFGPNDPRTDADGNALGPYLISGFKWFSSATDAQMTILLAAEAPGVISAFYAPLHRASPAGGIESNGVSIQRLKNKLGTRPLPTAELVLRDMRAWRIGALGAGVREIATVLTITRVQTAIGACGGWGRGLAINRAWARVRRVQGKLLVDVPAHMRALAAESVRYAGAMALAFFVVALLGVVERLVSFHSVSGRAGIKGLVGSTEGARLLLRLLTPVAKARCADRAVAGLVKAVEAMGGVGYVEDEQEINVARLLRDGIVNAIWEGTMDVMAADVARVVCGREGPLAKRTFVRWVKENTDTWEAEWEGIRAALGHEVRFLEAIWERGEEEIKYRGRRVLEGLEWVVAAVLLVEDARRDGNGVAREVAWRWVAYERGKSTEREDLERLWTESAAWDRKIAMGEDGRGATQANL
ncbi:acyl-CoA dehydrogenase/oxidase C-terminal [Trichodelitschia bisporula]|uniref:Acyl-CoA dehydrogenase/oxidase C-terminal n=1 Tax=Trichodelitschia bisporula TaxID=703511 RepID=A0A6G1I8E7_9PEZI|nr:acyl-CoA dehydrogenase/oxidase C-terminal [Trichodelitschia bisporula]